MLRAVTSGNFNCRIHRGGHAFRLLVHRFRGDPLNTIPLTMRRSLFFNVEPTRGRGEEMDNNLG